MLLDENWICQMESIGRCFTFLHSIKVCVYRCKLYFPRSCCIYFFTGAVASIQIYHTLSSPLLGNFLVGYGVREMIILETVPTVMAIVFAGRVGSGVAGQLGAMRN